MNLTQDARSQGSLTTSRTLTVLEHRGPSQNMPPLYSRWLAELGLVMDKEVAATCDTCPMCIEAIGDEPRFAADLKCCSFIPRLPNFLVGLVLADADPALAHGRASLRARMQDRSCVTPLGVSPRADVQLVYESANGFGRSPALRCPHLLSDGMCGIWAYRNGVCATWFCRHSRGAAGKAMWMRLHNLLLAVEEDLALACALELVSDDPSVTELTESLDQREGVSAAIVPAEAKRRFLQAWGAWSDRTEEFFLQCAAMVRDLHWNDVQQRCGVRVRARLRAALLEQQRFSEADIPERLIPAAFSVSAAGAEQLRLVTYSPLDPLSVGKDILSLLPYFNGTTSTPAVLAAIADGEQIALDLQDIRKLIDHGLLRPAL